MKSSSEAISVYLLKVSDTVFSEDTVHLEPTSENCCIQSQGVFTVGSWHSTSLTVLMRAQCDRPYTAPSTVLHVFLCLAHLKCPD